MAKPVIIVLEDMKMRIDWLRKFFDSRCHIVWVTTVTDFQSAVAKHNLDTKLIIFDHDLDMQFGSTGASLGPDGMNGLHAAEWLPGLMANTPILVWSRNGHKAPAIEETLNKRGFKNVYRLMFGFHRSIADYIKRSVGI